MHWEAGINTMENVIIIAVIALIIALSVRYLYKAKKRGAKCIGCPDGCSCGAGKEQTGSCCKNHKT